MLFSSAYNEFIIFCRFLQRDFYLYRSRIVQYVANYALIYPLLHAFSFGYLQSQVYFDANSALQGTILFTGNFLLVIVLLTYKLNIDLLFDLEGDRSIDYQITILRPQLVLLERIVFATFFSFFFLLPYFPVAKLLLGQRFVTAHISWLKLILVLFFSSLLGSTYNLLAACAIPNSNKIGMFWRRVNIPLFTIGGFWIPWYVMNKFSSALGLIARANPFIYITEGIRASILGGPDFISPTHCIISMLFFSIAFTVIAMHLFKKKLDHI